MVHFGQNNSRTIIQSLLTELFTCYLGSICVPSWLKSNRLNQVFHILVQIMPRTDGDLWRMPAQPQSTRSKRATIAVKHINSMHPDDDEDSDILCLTCSAEIFYLLPAIVRLTLEDFKKKSKLITQLVKHFVGKISYGQESNGEGSGKSKSEKHELTHG